MRLRTRSAFLVGLIIAALSTAFATLTVARMFPVAKHQLAPTRRAHSPAIPLQEFVARAAVTLRRIPVARFAAMGALIWAWLMASRRVSAPELTGARSFSPLRI